MDAYSGNIVEMSTHYLRTHGQRGASLDIESVILDSSDALRRAEALGGRAYRDTYPNAVVRLWLMRGWFEGEVFWGVGYFRPPEVRGSELLLGIEARTGEVRGDMHIPAPPPLPGA